MPGFRPGKVPRKVLEARMGGAGALRAEALREALPDFYAQAVVDTEVDPIAQPEIDITGGEDERRRVASTPSSRCGPLVAIPGYDGLQVTLPGLDVTDEEVQPRSTGCARTTPSSRRSTGRPSTATTSPSTCTATTPSDAEVVGVDDYLYEVGSGTVVPELDDELRGAKAGDILAFDAASPHEPEEHDRVPGARQGGEGQEAPRGHRRVGGRELGVRHGRRAARRHRRADRAG